MYKKLPAKHQKVDKLAAFNKVIFMRFEWRSKRSDYYVKKTNKKKESNCGHICKNEIYLDVFLASFSRFLK